MVSSAESKRGGVALYASESAGFAWQNIVLPWFQSATRTAHRQGGATVVAVPYRSHAYALKALLLEHAMSCVGVHFLTPPELRELLATRQGQHLPLREHLRLLLAVAAEDHVREHSSPGEELLPQYLPAKAVARAPDHLLRAIDQMGAAGWDFADVGPASLQEVYSRFEARARECRFQFVHEADRALLDPASDKPVIANLLITGFNGAHWPFWPLLRAAAQASSAATVILENPRDEARDLDQPWVGTWEEAFGEAAIPSVCDDGQSLNHGSVISAQSARVTDLEVLIGRNTTVQARAVVAKAATFLSDDRCTRLGILFAGSGALPRLVASMLARFGIEHNDGIAHLCPGPFEEEAFDRWVDLQQSRQLEALFRFLRAQAGRSKLIFAGLEPTRVEDILRRAYAEVVIDDLAVLAEFCRRQPSGEAGAVAEALGLLKLLPDQLTFAGYLALTRDTFLELGWDERWAEVDRLSRSWQGNVEGEFSRSTFLQWLTEISVSSARVRDRRGDHPYSRVHLLTFDEAEGQHWSHLILAGLNEGSWPREDSESGFLAEQEIESLNGRARSLNEQAVRQGRQGEGHTTVREGKTICLGPYEQRHLAARQLANLVEAASGGITVTANLFREAEPERRWNPSEFLMQLYFAARSRSLSHDTMERLAASTEAWLSKCALLPQEASADPQSVTNTRRAYDERRRATAPAGEYDFALRAPIAREITLRVTQWERALKSPALVWMNVFLGVESSDQQGDLWSSSTGQWVHRWLAKISDNPGSNRFAELPEQSEILRRVHAAAQGFRSEVESLCVAANRPLPDWWRSSWSNALFLSGCLAAHLEAARDCNRVATEWSLGPSVSVSLSPNENLRLRGRIDLILTNGDSDDTSLRAGNVWLVDFKTGGRNGLASRRWKTAEERHAGVGKKLVSGPAIQLGLYALALKELGAAEVKFGIVSPLVDLNRPQLHLADITAHREFWSELRQMQATGRFGMLGPLRSPWSFAGAYPLATLSVDNDVLVEKWTRTHPAFGEPPDEEESDAA